MYKSIYMYTSMDCCKEPPHILWEVVEVPLARSPSPVPLRREEKGHLHGGDSLW